MKAYMNSSLNRYSLILHSLPTSRFATATRILTARNHRVYERRTLTRRKPPSSKLPLILRALAAMCTSTEARGVITLKEKIELTETEEKIFERLRNTLRHFNLDTELRVAGGWVRDKLLGKDCYDIDIAIDNMLGSEFVDRVQEYLLSTGEEAQGVGVIPRNPDQSKHLETARMRLFDLWIDFVNLRCEEYSNDSRIPIMKFGTAEEDAYRRDLTINSLFYNINTGLVEDFTKKGINDLQSGKIVTPLPPKMTFLDDPLRVLRAIRFGARFGFILDEELIDAASCEEVKNALAAKISKERIGTEIDLMISGNQPVKAMQHVANLNLFCAVFPFPPEVEQPLLAGSHRLCVAFLEVAWNLIQSIGSLSFTDEQRRLALYAALFLPFRRTTYKDRKGKKMPVVNFIFKDSLKQKTSDSETVVKIHASIEKFLKLIPLLTAHEDTRSAEIIQEVDFFNLPAASKLRVVTGFLLREIKEFWRVTLLISTLLHPSKADSEQDFLDNRFQLEKRKDVFLAVEGAIMKLGLEKVWDVKPLLDGNVIKQVLQIERGGPLVKEWLHKVMAWQLAHPSGNTEECLVWIRETHSKRTRIS